VSEAPHPEHVVVVMPTWLGDCVMATPMLRALRGHWPDAELLAAARPAVAPILEHLPAVTRCVGIAARRKEGGGMAAAAKTLRAMDADAVILLPNSFRWAAVARLARVPRRIGYARDGRGWLLTDRLAPPRDGRAFTPVPARDYYLAIAERLGARVGDRSLELGWCGDDDDKAAAVLASAGYTDEVDRPLVVLNPGAQKASKRWPAERFAAVADALAADGAAVAVSGAPAERAVLDHVIEAARAAILDLPAAGLGLAALKPLLARTSLLITNDTGTRHIAAAVGTPVVSLFGPTSPAWTEIDFPLERIVEAPGDLDPGGESDRRSPSRTMAMIDTDRVVAAARGLLRQTGQTGQTGTGTAPRPVHGAHGG